MSKSKGNVMDPLVIMDQYGTDAFRFTLAAFAAQGRDIKMSEERIAGYRNFVNKIWNAARFTLMNLEGDTSAGQDLEPLLEDRWILSRAAQTAKEAAKAIEEYRFNDAASALYQFTWHEFCDWYLECVKTPLYNQNDPGRQAATRRVFARGIRPPYGHAASLHALCDRRALAKAARRRGKRHEGPLAPSADNETDPVAEEQMGLLMEVIGSVRNIRGEMGISPSQKSTQ